MSAPPLGLLLCDDLIFISRVAGTAKALGLAVQSARTGAALVELARSSPPACVIIDLHNPGLDLPELLRQLGQACPAMPRVVAYGSHVEAATLHAARVAGCDPVWPRSKFVEELAAALPVWLTSTEGPAKPGESPPAPPEAENPPFPSRP